MLDVTNLYQLFEAEPVLIWTNTGHVEK